MAVVVTRPDIIWQGRVGPCKSESRQCPFSAESWMITEVSIDLDKQKLSSLAGGQRIISRDWALLAGD